MPCLPLHLQGLLACSHLAANDGFRRPELFQFARSVVLHSGRIFYVQCFRMEGDAKHRPNSRFAKNICTCPRRTSVSVRPLSETDPHPTKPSKPPPMTNEAQNHEPGAMSHFCWVFLSILGWVQHGAQEHVGRAPGYRSTYLVSVVRSLHGLVALNAPSDASRSPPSPSTSRKLLRSAASVVAGL